MNSPPGLRVTCWPVAWAGFCILLAACNEKETRNSESMRSPPRQESFEAPESAVALEWLYLKWEMSKDGEVEVSNAPKRIRDLVGKRISLTGFMYPTVEARNLEGFLLMADQVTGFRYEGQLWQCVFVTMMQGHTVDYTTRPVTVVGTFSIEPMIEGEQPAVVYHVSGILYALGLTLDSRGSHPASKPHQSYKGAMSMDGCWRPSRLVAGMELVAASRTTLPRFSPLRFWPTGLRASTGKGRRRAAI